MPAQTFKSKDIDLVTYLCFEGFEPLGNPQQDSLGTRWVHFQKTPHLKKAVFSYLSGNDAARLLQTYRKTRSFILDSPPRRPKGFR